MQKIFFSNLFFIILLNLLIKPLYVFGIDIQVQNIVGSEDYGLYFSLLNFSLVLNMFLDIGVTNYNTKNTAQNPNMLTKYIGSFFGLKIMLGILYAIISIGFALFLGYSDKEMYFLSFFILNQVLVGLILYIRSNFSGMHMFKVDAILSVLDRLLLIIISAFLIYGHWSEKPFQIEWFIYAQTFAYGATLIIGLLLTRFKIGKIKVKANKVLSLAILRKSTPFAILILLMMLYTRMDAVMLERMLPNGKEQSGIYAQGFRLLDVINMFAFLVAGLLLPIFSRLLSESNSIKPILQMAGKFLIGVSLVVGIGLAMNSKLTIESIYNNNLSESSNVFFWLILCFIPLSFSHVFGTLLTANNNLRLLNQMAIFGVILNIGLNLILIPKMEAQGAAIATIITQSFTALLQLLLVMRVFKFSIDWKSISQLGIFVIVYAPLAYFMNDYFQQIWSLIATVGIGFLLLIFLKLVHFQDLLALLRTRTES
ncbi:oligosaccharide flippase family protein [Brumimicrobium mesophilum]|uniref:oligosaccharide flippase family protein n=1 Tax=Brumimicrobium mesophilum TaxID=392717 RepID=UPI000D14253C|nr:oligosaccharide flippase family protein [Brumimicrobium mesophilum]